jgi:hypothetical protein
MALFTLFYYFTLDLTTDIGRSGQYYGPFQASKKNLITLKNWLYCRRVFHFQQSGGMASGQSAPKEKEDTQHSVRRKNRNRIRFTR